MGTEWKIAIDLALVLVILAVSWSRIGGANEVPLVPLAALLR